MPADFERWVDAVAQGLWFLIGESSPAAPMRWDIFPAWGGGEGVTPGIDEACRQ